MKSLILYPEQDRYVLKRIFKIFQSQNLKIDACTINTKWDIDHLVALSGILNNYSHIFVVLSHRNLNEPWFINVLGYLWGSKKECFFYFTEESQDLNKFFLKYNCGQDYDDVLTYAKDESVRWDKLVLEEEAREYLIKTGFALSDDALGECVKSGHIDIVKKYIDAGYISSTRDSKGVPILCLAVRFEHLDIVRFLIDIGADINAISDDRNNSAVMDAASTGNLEAVKILVDEGADLESQSKNGQTALILAVGHGDEAISNYLLAAGANYEVKDSLGMSAKAYAKLFNKDDILKNMP